MPKYKAEYDATIPSSLIDGLALFENGSTIAHLAALLSAIVGWYVGYAALEGNGSIGALIGGSAMCGLVLGITFTRALGGPVLNLLASFAWPLISAAGLIGLGDLAPDQLASMRMLVVLMAPAFFITLGCMLVWLGILGPGGIDDWTHRHFPPAFFQN